MALFASMTGSGPAWDLALPMREQLGWTEHAAFMEALVDDGFVLLGGPIGDGSRHRVLLILDAADEAEVRSRLAADIWYGGGVLSLASVEPWTVLLGEPGWG